MVKVTSMTNFALLKRLEELQVPSVKEAPLTNSMTVFKVNFDVDGKVLPKGINKIWKLCLQSWLSVAKI
jgi:hypothetical protein